MSLHLLRIPGCGEPLAGMQPEGRPPITYKAMPLSQVLAGALQDQPLVIALVRLFKSYWIKYSILLEKLGVGGYGDGDQ